jgi:uncharacterized protein (DUF302 family)
MTAASWFILGLVLGLLLMGAAVWFAMPKLMLIKRRSGQSYAQTVQSITDALQKVPDWQLKLLNDYQERTASFGKLEHACSMSICNARLAYNILSEEGNRGVTAIMPPAIGVYEDKHGQVYTSLLNLGLLGMMFGGTIARVMKLAARDFKTIVSSASGK